MKNITEIIMCPECHNTLTADLKCSGCGRQYGYRHGVYNLISTDLSGDQFYLNKIEIPSDKAGMDELFYEIFGRGNLSDEELSRDYYARCNQETLDGIRKQKEHMNRLLSSLSGVVCDLATGGGTMLQQLIDSGNPNIQIVCTDINELELICTRIRRNGEHTNISFVTTDGRYLSIRDNSFDYIVSLSGFGNIPEGDKVAKELYRVLKPSGKLIIQGEYIEKGTKSYELAVGAGVERGVVEEYLIEDLEKAGFEDVCSEIIAEAIWAENPYDLIPAAGDNQRFCLIFAEKKE
ncbi:MAG: methyltransferase domain-containing protein [Clostridia bacterium]|nr:methyltransferase domain-containing protein [Clostridia bacterium]MBR5364794.1 methyltransferase domain-containing protein [Clostridia bacterium]